VRVQLSLVFGDTYETQRYIPIIYNTYNSPFSQLLNSLEFFKDALMCGSSIKSHLERETDIPVPRLTVCVYVPELMLM